MREMCHPCKNCGKCMRRHVPGRCPICGSRLDAEKNKCAACGFAVVAPPGQSMKKNSNE